MMKLQFNPTPMEAIHARGQAPVRRMLSTGKSAKRKRTKIRNSVLTNNNANQRRPSKDAFFFARRSGRQILNLKRKTFPLLELAQEKGCQRSHHRFWQRGAGTQGSQEIFDNFRTRSNFCFRYCDRKKDSVRR